MKKFLVAISLYFFILPSFHVVLAQNYKGEVPRPVLLKSVSTPCKSCVTQASNCSQSSCCSSLFLPSCYSCSCADPNCASNPCLSSRRLCSAFGNIGALDDDGNGCAEVDYY